MANDEISRNNPDNLRWLYQLGSLLVSETARLKKLANANLVTSKGTKRTDVRSEDDLKELIRGESRTVELKRGFGWDTKSPRTDDHKAQKDYRKHQEQVYRTVGGSLTPRVGLSSSGSRTNRWAPRWLASTSRGKA